jgi:drug/metabolite transporter (DMT)-like permease
MKNHPMFGLLLATFGVLVLTPDVLFMRLSGMNAFQMVAWRGLLMGTVLLVAWLVLERRSKRPDLLALASGAGVAVVLCQMANTILFNVGIAHAPVSVVLFGVATVPVFSAIAAYLIAGETTGRATWITIAAVLVGIGIAVFSDGSNGVGLNAASLIGASAGLGVAMVFAIYFVVLRMHRSLAILPTIGLGALLSGCVGLTITGPAAVFEGNVWAITISGAVLLPISFFAISLATRHTHPSNVSLLLLLETILGPAWVWYGIGERPSPQMIFGGAIVVLSLAAYLLHTRRRAHRAAACLPTPLSC